MAKSSFRYFVFFIPTFGNGFIALPGSQATFNSSLICSFYNIVIKASNTKDFHNAGRNCLPPVPAPTSQFLFQEVEYFLFPVQCGLSPLKHLHRLSDPWRERISCCALICLQPLVFEAWSMIGQCKHCFTHPCGTYFFYFILSYFPCWGQNPGLYALQAGVLPLSPRPSPSTPGDSSPLFCHSGTLIYLASHKPRTYYVTEDSFGLLIILLPPPIEVQG